LFDASPILPAVGWLLFPTYPGVPLISSWQNLAKAHRLLTKSHGSLGGRKFRVKIPT
jgi:hypothetical protein